VLKEEGKSKEGDEKRKERSKKKEREEGVRP
jgi:hypothetical protein